jgi:hypothetical protein
MRFDRVTLTKENAFLSLPKEFQENDILYQKLSENGQEFARSIIEIIMNDLGIKEDHNIIAIGGRQK